MASVCTSRTWRAAGRVPSRRRASPCGRLVAAISPDRIARLYPVEGGDSVPVAGIVVGDRPLRFSGDGRALYVHGPGGPPVRVFKIDLSTGQRDLWREISPVDHAGISGTGGILLTADGHLQTYDFARLLSELYVAEGLK